MDRLRCCVRLFIVQFFVSAGANADDWLYTIKPGDTLWEVCADYITGPKPRCIAKLQAYNTQITNKRKLPPGMQISIPISLLKYPPQSAVVEFTQGDAFLVQSGLSQKKALKAGTALIIGNKVITDEGSVLIRFADESTLLLKPNSEIRMNKLSAHGEYGMVDTYIYLQRGNAAMKVKPKGKNSRFMIKTPSAVAAVRGTEFRISSDPATNNTMRNEVLLGEVAVSAEAVVQAIKKGFGTLAEQDKAPLPPRKLLAAPTISVQTPLNLPYTLSWSALDGAVGYVLDIFKGDSTDKLLQSHALDNNSHRLAGLDDGNYTLSVRGVDEVGLQGLDAILSFIKENLLPAPHIDPSAINPVANQLHISWAPIADAKSYRVDVGSDAQFSQLIYSTVVKEHSVSVPLLTRHHYFVRAQAIDRHGRLSEPGPVTQWTNKAVELWLALAVVVVSLLLVLRFR